MAGCMIMGYTEYEFNKLAVNIRYKFQTIRLILRLFPENKCM